MEKVMCGTCKSPSAPTAAVKSDENGIKLAPDSLAEPNAGSWTAAQISLATPLLHF